ncbi:hypothetical protein [Luteimicrobium subarcticum]|uniref:HEPN domain-containing protein n=1 Tax=Luteimicrobium subarcticum TaxID=620910 RepID=A0A2M8WUV7_9MICO|nr:hypothetical protein [Luteimicrobium subarcticum]PJI94694.1 hypothetical protein CLV34_0540 [Luteimicrobium subarcticum]
MTKADVRMRAEMARKYLEVAQLVMGEEPADRQVAAGVAVLAAIAASDAMCGVSLGGAPQGQSHDEAVRVLAGIRPLGEQLAKNLRRVLADKASSQYGTTYLSPAVVGAMLKNAQALVDGLAAHGL